MKNDMFPINPKQGFNPRLAANEISCARDVLASKNETCRLSETDRICASNGRFASHGFGLSVATQKCAISAIRHAFRLIVRLPMNAFDHSDAWI